MKPYKRSLTHPYKKSYKQASCELDVLFAQQRERVIQSLEDAEYRVKDRLRTLHAEDEEATDYKEWELIQR